MRFLRQNKIFAAINLFGLSIALASSFIILLFVINELSYNHFNKKSKRIFRVLNYYVNFNMTMSGTPYILATALKEEFPQIEKAIRVSRIPGFKLKLKDEFINVNDAITTDSEIFDIFTIPLIGGSFDKNLLDDQNSIVLSHELAERFFSDQDPVGHEIIGLVNNVEHVFIVRGIFENIPENSTLRASCLLSIKWTVEDINKAFGITNTDSNWTNDFFITWVLLSKDCNPKNLEKQFRAFEVKYMSGKAGKNFSLQNLSDVYLGSENVANAGIIGNRNNVSLFSAIAFLILLVATVNYIILSTAVSTGRGLEIGIRKTFGATNRRIKNQLLSESVLLAIIVLPIAIILTKVTLPYAGRLFQTKLNIISSNIVIYTSVYLILTIIIGIISGLYTSSYLSRQKVIDIIKNSIISVKGKQILRSTLIILQLIIFCSFVSSTLIIRSQYKYALNKDLGYYTKDILMMDLGRDFKGYSAFINSIKSNPNVIMAAGVMDGLPMQGSMT